VIRLAVAAFIPRVPGDRGTRRGPRVAGVSLVTVREAGGNSIVAQRQKSIVLVDNQAGRLASDAGAALLKGLED